jgi:nucleoside-diphosphate-sugar epimerase
MFQNFNEKSLLGLPVYRGIPPPPPPPPNPHQSLPPHLGPPPGLFQYSAQPTQVFESNNKYDDIMMIDNEIKRMNIVCEDLTNQKYDIDRKILDVTRRIDVLLSKRESIKRSIPIERNLFQKSKRRYLSLQKGDIVNTLSSKLKIKKYLNLSKTTDYKEGIKNFVQWYLSHYKINV